MKLKEKLILGGIILSACTVFNLFFTAAVHGLLLRQYKTLTLIPFFTCVDGLLTQKRQLLLFLVFECFAALCCTLFFVQNSRPYQSDLINVTEDIQTPAPVGQYQHGSARWLKENEKAGVFDMYALDPANRIIKELIHTGYGNLDFMKKGSDIREYAAIARKSTNPSCVPAKTQLMEELHVPQKNVPRLLPVLEREEYFESVENPFAAMEPEESLPPQMEPVKKKRMPPEKDRYKLLKHGGVVIGMTRDGSRENIYYLSDDTHSLTIGATRSGKTRTLVIQSICLLGLAGESLVISDPKSELYEYTSEFLAKTGYEVICLDFKNPEKSARYNLLQPIIDAVAHDDMEKAETYAWDITNILVGDNVSDEKIWENGEKSTIAAAILCVVVDNAKRPEFQNLTNVYWFIAEMSKSVGGKTPMQEYVKKLKQGHPARALLSISDVAPSRTKGSFYTSALTTLRLFTSKSIYSITHKTDYDISEIGRKKQALFFALPDDKSTYYPIASLIVSQLYELLVRQSDERGGRLENRVNFILDEFGNFAKLNDFTNKLTVAGGRGIRFNLFLQSFEQLTEKYNKETAAIVKSNCQTWVYLQADDKETLQEICDKLGKYTTSAYQLSSQHGRYVNPSSSHTINLVGRDLLTTDEIRRISRPHQIVVSRSHPAMMLSPDLSQWYFNKMLGLGDKEHNRRVREERQSKRPAVSAFKGDIPLWNIWNYYTKDLQLKEDRQKNQVFAAQTGSMFSEKSMMKKGGPRVNYEDEE